MYLGSCTVLRRYDLPAALSISDPSQKFWKIPHPNRPVNFPPPLDNSTFYKTVNRAHNTPRCCDKCRHPRFPVWLHNKADSHISRKPRNARSKRALDKRAPKAVENPKTVLFLRGTTCSQTTQDALADLTQLRQPLAKKFTKKNAIHPFEDASSLEFFSEKNDASFLVFGSSSKKRPNCLTFVRTFGYKILDMLELYLDGESYRRLDQFKGTKPAVGLRPMLVFAGTAFESTVANEYTMAKSLLTDFFAADRTADKIDVEGLQYVVVVTAEEGGATGLDDGMQPAIHLRAYLIRTKRSGQRLPRVEVSDASTSYY